MKAELRIENIGMCKDLLWRAKAEKKPHVMIVKPYVKNRKESQNKLQHHWNGEIHTVRQTIENFPVETTGQLRAYNKYRFGVPIMLEIESFEKSWRHATGHLNYKTILELIEELDIPITRLMNIKQMTRFLSDMQIFWIKKGVQLTNSQDLYFEAMGIKR